MKENFLVRNFNLLRLMNKNNLTNDEIYYLIINHDNKEKVIKKIGIEKIFSLGNDRLLDVFKQVLFNVEGALNLLFDSDIKLSDEVLLLEYNGKKILEYWLKRKAEKKLQVDVSSLMKNPDIIMSLLQIEEELKKSDYRFFDRIYEKIWRNEFNETLLLVKDGNDKTLLERLIEYNNGFKLIMYAYNITVSTPEMIKIFLKCNKLDLLSRFIIDSELLLENFDELCDESQKGSYNGTLLGYLLDNNINYQKTNFLSFETVLVYIDKNKLSCLNNGVLQDEVLLHPYQDKTLLEYLWDRKININLKECRNSQIFKICFLNKKFDLFIDASDDVFDIIVEDDKTVFDLMLENGIYPWKYKKNFELQNIPRIVELVLKLLKYGYYEKVLEEAGNDVLFYEVDTENHKTIFDVVVENLPNLENNPYRDKIVETLKSIINGSSSDKVVQYPIEVWLFEYDTKKHLTLLDFALNKHEFIIGRTKFKNLLTRIDIIEWLVGHDKLGVFLRASKESLLYKVPFRDNKPILQLILEKHRSKYIETNSSDKAIGETYMFSEMFRLIHCIDQRVLSDPEIRYIIFAVTGSTDYFKDTKMSKAQDLGVVTHEMVESSMWQTYGLLGPLDAESEALLQEFVEVMKTGIESDDEIINLAVISFRKLIIRNNPLGVIDLRRIIEVKNNNLNFHMVYDQDRGSCYSSEECCIYINNKYDIRAFEHELTHMFHHHYATGETPVEFNEVFKRCISTQGFYDRVLLFMKELYTGYNAMSERYGEEFIKEYPTEGYFQLIDEQFKQILFNSKDFSKIKKFIISLINKGIKGETIKGILKIMKNSLSVEEIVNIKMEYFKQLLVKDEVSYLLYRLDKQFANEMNVTNFLDAVLEGGLNKLVKQEIGNVPFAFHMHGEEYFWQHKRLVFAEVIATYVSIRKSDNSEELIGRLREIIGDELIDYLENYYVSQLTLTEERRK